MDYSRIESSVDMGLIRASHIVIVGSGGSYSLATSLARTGIGKLTVLDFDTVEETNIVRQGYKQADIGNFKVNALGEEIQRINPEVEYTGIIKNFLEMNEEELALVEQKVHKGDEGRTLSPIGHVRGAEIPQGHRPGDCGNVRQLPQLQGGPGPGHVEHRLPMGGDKVQLPGASARVLQHAQHRLADAQAQPLV